MTQPPASAPPNNQFAVLRAWEIGFLILLVAGLFAAFWIKSRKEYLGHDEFITAVLVANPSLPEMLDTIRNGGETNPPLYFILEWVVARGFGTGEEALRALSAICMALAAVVVFLTLRRVVGGLSAALAVGFVFGLSWQVSCYMGWARYYGVFVLLAAVLAFLFLRITTADTVRWRDVGLVFLVHAALVFLHLFGALFSGMFLVTLVAVDWLRGRWSWRLIGAVVGAWAVFFLLWGTALPKQFAVTSSGSWTPRINLGMFLDELAMQIPLAVVLLLSAALAAVTALARPAGEKPPAARPGSLPLLALGLAWMVVPVLMWGVSQIRHPIYMQRYVAPCVVALALILAVSLWAAQQLPRPEFGLPGRVPGWLPGLMSTGIIVFCLTFQPWRAMKGPPRADRAFTDVDFGHANVPIVFEDSMDFLPRAYYGKGREYLLLIDHEAAEASDGYFTKQMERLFNPFRAHYPGFKVRHAAELPVGAEGFLVVNSPQATTFDWILTNRPGFTAERLGTWPDGQEVLWARRTAN